MKTEDIQKIEHSMMFLATFARSYYTFYAIYEHLDSLDYGLGYLFPFRNICNALISDAAISWCKVFGSNKEKTHWKFSIENQEEFKLFLFAEIKIEQSVFNDYWLKMTAFRSNVVAHFNSQHFEGGETLSFELALKSAVATHKYLRMQFPENVNYTGPLCLESYGRAVAEEVLNRLHV